MVNRPLLMVSRDPREYLKKRKAVEDDVDDDGRRRRKKVGGEATSPFAMRQRTKLSFFLFLSPPPPSYLKTNTQKKKKPTDLGPGRDPGQPHRRPHLPLRARGGDAPDLGGVPEVVLRRGRR